MKSQLYSKHRLGQRWCFSHRSDCKMEKHIHLPTSIPWRLLFSGEDSSQVGNIQVGCTVCSETREGRFNGGPKLERIKESLVVVPDDPRRRLLRGGMRFVCHEGSATAPRTCLDKAFGTKSTQCLPDCRATHAEPTRQFPFGRQPLAGASKPEFDGHQQSFVGVAERILKRQRTDDKVMRKPIISWDSDVIPVPHLGGIRPERLLPLPGFRLLGHRSPLRTRRLATSLIISTPVRSV
jgi:hypothetical protein